MAKNDMPAAKAGTNQGGAAKPSQGPNTAQGNSAASTAGLEVISTRDGFRRAGLIWGKKPAVIPLADLSQEQIDMLKSEPILSVREVELDTEAKGQ